MPFPTEAQTEGKTEIKLNPNFQQHDFENLDDLLQDLNTAKQVFKQPGEDQAPGSQPAIDFNTDNLPPETISREEAERAGRRMAKLTDSILSVTGMTIAKEQDPEKYKATAGEIDDMAAAWSEVAEEYKFKMNPWFNIALLTLMIYMPKMVQASNDRRVKILEEKQKEFDTRLKVMEERKKEVEKSNDK